MDFTNPEWALAFEYSEWLDQQGLMVDESVDGRTHEELANQFLSERERGE